MIYGDVKTQLPVSYIDEITRKGIPIIVHRRNMAQAVYICGSNRPDPDDTISAQIRTRDNLHKRAHIVRQLLKAKFESMKWLMDTAPQLEKHMTIEAMRNLEAKHSREYWKRYFTLLGQPDWTRRSKNPYSQALDASSKFISGVLLRWTHYHHLSAYHGFLHEMTDYPTLVYDLIEPYRGTYDQILFEALRTVPSTDDNTKLTGACISALKEAFDRKIYTGLTRQIVTRQELLHGSVLSMKYYLLGHQSRFLVPTETRPNGGRPPKVAFRLYGRQAGRTDFWDRAREAARNSTEVAAAKR
jgi:CRISPR/Cas system-associated endonuclease Cas1